MHLVIELVEQSVNIFSPIMIIAYLDSLYSFDF